MDASTSGLTADTAGDTVPGQNDVFLNADGIIEIHVVGDQTEASVRAMGESALELARACRDDGRPVLIIDNLLRMGQVPPAGRQAVVAYGKRIDYDRLALVGNGALLRLGTNLLIQAVGKAGRLRYFDSLPAATAWLRRRRR